MPFKGQIFGKSYSKSPDLTSLTRTHTEEKPYKCSLCEKTFAGAGGLRYHLRSHTGLRPYKCQVCEKSFASSSNLTNHTRVHTGDKPYKCQICGKSCSQATNLATHMRLHTAKKPEHSWKDEKPRSVVKMCKPSHLAKSTREHVEEMPSFTHATNLDARQKPKTSQKAEGRFSQSTPTNVTFIKVEPPDESQNNEQPCSVVKTGDLPVLTTEHGFSLAEPTREHIGGDKSFTHATNLEAHHKEHKIIKPKTSQKAEGMFSQSTPTNVTFIKVEPPDESQDNEQPCLEVKTGKSSHSAGPTREHIGGDKPFTHATNLEAHQKEHKIIKPKTSQKAEGMFSQSTPTNVMLIKVEPPDESQNNEEPCSVVKTGKSSHLAVPTGEHIGGDKSFTHATNLEAHQKEHKIIKPKTSQEAEGMFSQSTPTNVTFIKVEPPDESQNNEQPRSVVKTGKSSHSARPTRKRTGHKPFKCQVCDKQFARASDLTCHTRTHIGEKPFKCQICNRKFAGASDLTYHTRTHIDEKPHTCKICGKSFSKSSSIANHMRIHKGEKLYKCQICGKSYSRPSRLAMHSRAHAGVKPHKCLFCDKTFAGQAGLNYHMRSHTGERPYKCHVCGKAFKSSSTLTGHMRIHTGERPYKCQICDKAFYNSANVVTHQKVHQVKKPKETKKVEGKFSHLTPTSITIIRVALPDKCKT